MIPQRIMRPSIAHASEQLMMMMMMMMMMNEVPLAWHKI